MPDSSDPVVEGAVGDAPTLGERRHSADADADWTVAVVDRVDAVVAALRGKTTTPITKMARALVFGLVVGAMGVAALILAVIGILRLHVYLPFHPEARRVWVTYVGLGAIFMAIGAFAWRKRTIRTKE
jgi:porphobilinogen deaminase